MSPDEVAETVHRAAQGDRSAWDRIVNEYIGMVWSIARSYRLNESDAADVSQTTWLRLLEHIDRLTDPTRLGGWLATTTRRECLRVLARQRRTVLTGELANLEAPDEFQGAPDAALLAQERAEVVHDAVATLPVRWQRLLELLMSDPPPSYQEISALLELPVGSIGPTRARCLKKLRPLVET